MRARALFPALLTAFACDSEPSAAVVPDLGEGKMDAGEHVVMHEPLSFGETRDGAFVEDLEFHGYPLSVRQGSKVTLELSHAGSSSTLDATLFVFGPRTATGWGTEALAFDDDSGSGKLPRLRQLELSIPGDYLVVVGTRDGRGRGHYRLNAACASGACEPFLDSSSCIFGELYADIFRSPHLVTTSEGELHSAEGIDPVRAEQLVVATHQSTHDDVTTAQEAFARVDQGEFNVHDVWDVTNERAFEVIEYGAGDNSFGAVFEHGTTEIAASIIDGEILGCTVGVGAAASDCHADDECTEGRMCVGIHPELGVGRCVDATPPAGTGSECSHDMPCDPTSGLACAGLTRSDAGQCLPAWMRGTFLTKPLATIPDDGWSASFDVYGLASVDTDVELDVIALGSASGPARVTVTNPDGAEVLVWEGEANGGIYLVDEPVLGFTGDAAVVGTWQVRIEGAAGATLHRVLLRIGSRFD